VEASEERGRTFGGAQQGSLCARVRNEDRRKRIRRADRHRLRLAEPQRALRIDARGAVAITGSQQRAGLTRAAAMAACRQAAARHRRPGARCALVRAPRHRPRGEARVLADGMVRRVGRMRARRSMRMRLVVSPPCGDLRHHRVAGRKGVEVRAKVLSGEQCSALASSSATKPFSLKSICAPSTHGGSSTRTDIGRSRHPRSHERSAEPPCAAADPVPCFDYVFGRRHSSSRTSAPWEKTVTASIFDMRAKSRMFAASEHRRDNGGYGKSRPPRCRRRSLRQCAPREQGASEIFRVSNKSIDD
jgi:hypothetical protein